MTIRINTAKLLSFPHFSIGHDFSFTEVVHASFSSIKDFFLDVSKSFGKLPSLFMDLFGKKTQQAGTNNFMNNTSGMRTSRFNTPKIKGVFKKLFYVLCATLLVAITVNVFKRLNTKSADAKIELKSATSTTNIDRELSFPLKNANGEEVSSFAYTLEKAELRDEIIVEGKRATAIAGRTFLIINIKLVNNYDSAIQINSKDYVRLSVNGNKDEWLAPDIHNDPIEVQAISTKLSRIGFPIDDTATDLVLRVGEVRGEKEEIPLSF